MINRTAAFLLFALVSTMPVSAQLSSFTVTRNDGIVIVANPLAAGVAMGGYGSYDSDQVCKNLVGCAGSQGFEPVRTIAIWVQEVAGTGTAGVASANSYYTKSIFVSTGATATFNALWTGATDTIVQSSNASLVGCSDIVSSAGIQGSEYSETGVKYNFSPGGSTSGLCGGTPAGTVHIVTSLVQTPVNGSAYTSGLNGFGAYAQGGGTVTWDTAAPLSGLASMRMNTIASGAYAYVNFGFDSLLSNRYVAMNGTYQITVKMRLNAGTATLPMSLIRSTQSGRPAGVLCNSGQVTVPSTAGTVTWTCVANEDGTSSKPDPGVVNLQILGNGNDVDIDDASIVKISGQDATNTSVFRDEYVAGLRQFYSGHRGLFRFGPVIHNGETFANWTQPANLALQTAFTAYGTPNAHPQLQDFLWLCQAIGADPYLHLPAATTAADAASYTRYFFSTNTSDAEVILRTAQGHAAPWGGPTGTFPNIFLTFANEAWMSSDNVAGGTMPQIPGAADAYAQYLPRAGTLFQAMRAQASFPAAQYVTLLADLQFTNTYGFTTELAALPANGRPDGAESSDYISVPFTSNSTNESMWRLGLSTPYTQLENPSASWAIIVALITGQNSCGGTGTTRCKLTVYESGPGDTQACGATGYPLCQTTAANAIIDVVNLQAINVGAGMGVIMADELWENMANGVTAQNHFESDQTGTKGGPTNPSTGIADQAYVWGMAVDYGGALSAMDGASVRARPQMLGLEVANAAVIGNMTSCTNNGPSYSQPAGPSPLVVPATTVPTIQTRCFADGAGNLTIGVVNRSTSTAYTMNVAGTNAATAPVTIPVNSVTTVSYSTSALGTVNVLQYAPTNLSAVNEATAQNPTSNTPFAATNTAPKTLFTSAFSTSVAAAKLLFMVIGGQFKLLVQ